MPVNKALKQLRTKQAKRWLTAIGYLLASFSIFYLWSVRPGYTETSFFLFLGLFGIMLIGGLPDFSNFMRHVIKLQPKVILLALLITFGAILFLGEDFLIRNIIGIGVGIYLVEMLALPFFSAALDVKNGN